MKHFYAFWLTPSNEDSLYLGNIIQQLAFEHTSMTFLPHITIYGTVYMESTEAAAILQSAVTDIKPLNIEIDRVTYTSEFFKSIYIQIKTNENLEKLHNSFNKQLNDHVEYAFDPHISLIYQNLTSEQKEGIIKNIQIKNTYRMESVCTVNLGQKEEDIYKIDQWRVEHAQLLQ